MKNAPPYVRNSGARARAQAWLAPSGIQVPLPCLPAPIYPRQCADENKSPLPYPNPHLHCRRHSRGRTTRRPRPKTLARSGDTTGDQRKKPVEVAANILAQTTGQKVEWKLAMLHALPLALNWRRRKRPFLARRKSKGRPPARPPARATRSLAGCTYNGARARGKRGHAHERARFGEAMSRSVSIYG